MDPRDTTIEGPHGPLGVRVYPAEHPTGSALVWAHGGGFAAGSVDMPEGDAVARAFAARDVPTVSVDYRLAPVVAGSRWGDEDRAGVRYPVASEAAGADISYRVEPGTRHGHLNRPDEPGFAPTIDTFVRRLTTL
ncbi:alpha/beta hydrolase fold domain-containing protein [Microbacterium sp. ZXX196]|uniref:alpha/beta hydrolase fold domain-containing protein n=1 Tax=Microbacterium sp. ZXX196 TaxID=2609291 RepID=UPI0012B97245|nr:alpha/beta hydrolase fold domain-containing protein [Microbacterium sp. ZXX196]MTE24308.1 alpha/beta hydrolase fold domain-containing protein [Microbacterium sp. ZXX196]